MTWLNNFFGKVKTLSAGAGVPGRAMNIGDYRSPVLMARGKWVVYENKVAIVAGIEASGIAELHFVNDVGVTVGSLPVPVGQFRLAKYLEIPAARRPADANWAASLGYI